MTYDPVIADLNRYLSDREAQEMEEEHIDKIASDIFEGGYIDSLGNSWSLEDLPLEEICYLLSKNPLKAQDLLFDEVYKEAEKAHEFEKDLFFEGD